MAAKARAAAGSSPAADAVSAREVDRVVMPSLRADGTPDQSEGFELIDVEGPAAAGAEA